MGKCISRTYRMVPYMAVCVNIPTLLLFRVLDIRLLRKLKVRITRYFSDSTFAGMLYLSESSSSILQEEERVSDLCVSVYRINIILVLADNMTSFVTFF